MKYTLNNREVEILETELEVGEGVYIVDAIYVDNDQPLTDTEMDKLQDKYQAELYEDNYSNAVSNAYDRVREG